MKRKKKQFIAVILAAIMTISMFPASFVSAEDKTQKETILSVEELNTFPGDTVKLSVSIKNNPGILGATLKLEYDEGLSLMDAETGDAFRELTMTKPGKYTSPCKFFWDGQELKKDNITDGTILVLTFKVSDSVQSGSKIPIKVSYSEGDIVDDDLNPVNVIIENGYIFVDDYLPGDLNGDKKVNTSDVILMRRHITGGYDIEINEKAADVNADGKCNTSDVILLRRYITGGYGVKLLRSTEQASGDEHELKYFEFKAASCTEDGNMAYWYCEKCDKYYSDEKGNNEISKENIVIPATGHTVVIDPSLAPTYTSEGRTEGSHCSVCDTVLVKQETVPKLEQKHYAITYNLYGEDTYLATIGVENPNPDYYTSDGLRLKSLSAKGYLFEGWYDGNGKSATKITKIDPGETGDIELFAKWSLAEYEVQFDSPLVEIPSQKYTVNKGLTLKSPNLNGYNFMGWTDEEGEIVNSIKKGTTGSLKLKANWTSKRNQTKPVKKLDDPLIVEDTDKGQILFAYEIGSIENVPLYEIKKIGNAVNGLVQVEHEEVTKSISEADAKTITEAISNATTNSQSWTLSEDWNKVTSVSETYLKQTGESKTNAETNAKTSSNTYSLNSSSGGSHTSVDSHGTSSKIGYIDTNGNSSTSTSSATNSSGYELGMSTKINTEAGISASVGGSGASVKMGAEIGGSASASRNSSNTKTSAGTSSWNNSHNEEGVTDDSNVTTNASSWNSSSGYSNSNSTSHSQTVSNTLSSLIAETKGYGSSYAEGGSKSNAWAYSNATTESKQYSSTLTYTTSETTTKEKTYTMNGESEGYYRIVQAGTVHVFAVVGYDVASKSYFVYTYNVMDDNTYEYVDYSRNTAKFNDEENGVLPFEVPIFVNDYVNYKIAKSDNLEINMNTGMISRYTGNDKVVIIPSYVSVDNKDGTNSAIKVKGIESGVFTGNKNLVSVKLSDFITDILASEFKGCTALKDVIAEGVTSIGNSAFSGCVSLNRFDVPEGVTSLGNNAFKDVNEISVEASSQEVAQAATNSGAKKVVLDISSAANAMKNSKLEMDSCEYFELRGKDKSYSGLSIISNAKNTVLNGIRFTDVIGIPMQIDSAALTLNRVSATCPGYVMMLRSENTIISLQGTIDLVSESGNAIVCRNVSLNQLDSSVAGRLKVSGNIYVCGKIEQNNYLSISNGSVITISEEEYEKYIKGSYNITFDANEGTVSENSRVAFCGTPIGELPAASRDYYSFEGWFTEKDGGDKVSEKSVYSTAFDIVLYAHWKQNDISDWVKVGSAPSDAQTVNTKWTYTLREYSESSGSSKSGWTKYDTRRTSWGGTQGPVYSDPNNGARNVWSESYVTSSNYKTVYHYYRYSKSWSGGGGSDVSGTTYGSNYYTYDFDNELTQTGTNGNNSRGYRYYYNGSNYMTVWRCNPFTTQEKVSDNYGTRWYFQDPVYTYYYYRDVNKEATSDPSGQKNVSQVQKWVQYRKK